MKPAHIMSITALIVLASAPMLAAALFDLDGNDLFNSADTALFRSQFLIAFAAGSNLDLLPWTDDGAAFDQFLQADLTGDSDAAMGPDGWLFNPITDSDLQQMQQCYQWLSGDINWDGSINFSDLAILGANYGSHNATLFHGDLNFNGTVNLSDLSLLSVNWGQSYQLCPSPPLIPEPTTLAILAAGAFCLVRRRRFGHP